MIIWRQKMLELYNLGISELDLKNIIEMNPDITNISEEEIRKLIMILKQINCNDKMVRNIIISNPFYLSRIDTDIINLINKLASLGLSTLNLLFDTNPYLLNKDTFEIEEFLKKKQKEYSIEEIVDMIDSNPYIIEED